MTSDLDSQAGDNDSCMVQLVLYVSGCLASVLCHHVKARITVSQWLNHVADVRKLQP